jgi:hypothetical protein
MVVALPVLSIAEPNVRPGSNSARSYPAPAVRFVAQADINLWSGSWLHGVRLPRPSRVAMCNTSYFEHQLAGAAAPLAFDWDVS